MGASERLQGDAAEFFVASECCRVAKPRPNLSSRIHMSLSKSNF